MEKNHVPKLDKLIDQSFHLLIMDFVQYVLSTCTSTFLGFGILRCICLCMYCIHHTVDLYFTLVTKNFKKIVMDLAVRYIRSQLYNSCIGVHYPALIPSRNKCTPPLARIACMYIPCLLTFLFCSDEVHDH